MRNFVLSETTYYYVLVPDDVPESEVENYLYSEVSEYDGDVQGFTDFWEEN